MRVTAATEEIEPGRWVATADGYEGARGYGSSPEEATEMLSVAVHTMHEGRR